MNTYLCAVMMLMAYRSLIAAPLNVTPYTVYIKKDGSIVATSSELQVDHTIAKNYKCVLTGRLIKDYLDEARRRDTFFLLGAYTCDQSDAYRYVDGKTLLTRQLRIKSPRGSIDPISKHKIERTAFFECIYIDGLLEIRGLGDVSQAKSKGALLHNMMVYMLAKDAELAMRKHNMLEQKLQEYNCSSLISDYMCIANGQMAYQMEDLYRAYAWYRLADGGMFTSVLDRMLLSKGCLDVAIACGLKRRALAIPLLEKVFYWNCSDELVGEAAGRLGELHQDRRKRLFWMERSAKAGSLNGMCNLGIMYRKDDMKKAIYWHQQAAQRGALPGMMHLFLDIAIEPKRHGIAPEMLCDYANKLVEVFNKKYATDDQENYVRNVFPEKASRDYAWALEVVKLYATVPMLDEFA